MLITNSHMKKILSSMNQEENVNTNHNGCLSPARKLKLNCVSLVARTLDTFKNAYSLFAMSFFL